MDGSVIGGGFDFPRADIESSDGEAGESGEVFVEEVEEVLAVVVGP
jgi:hypothetical protein